jgi:HSP20 family protein
MVGGPLARAPTTFLERTMTPLMLRRDALPSLFDEFFNDVFQRAAAPAARAAGNDPRTALRPRMDVIDRGERFEVLFDLPGVAKQDIQVSIEGARLSLSAEHNVTREFKDGERLLHAERVAACYARSVELPAEVAEEGACASFDNGVLRLDLPKRAAVASKRLTIQ